jgi:hypothetical protein
LNQAKTFPNIGHGSMRDSHLVRSLNSQQKTILNPWIPDDVKFTDVSKCKKYIFLSFVIKSLSLKKTMAGNAVIAGSILGQATFLREQN